MTSYKTCAVPMCRSTTIKCPNKLFIHVPKCPKRRKQWLQLARRDPQFTSDKSAIFFCEDHFDLPYDMENYIQYSIMGSIGKIKMKPDCLPLKFHCQPDRIKRTGPPQPRSVVSKRLRMHILQEIFSQEMPSTSGKTCKSDSISNTSFSPDEKHNFQDQMIQVYPERTDKLTQVCLSAKVRSKSVQTTSQAKDKNSSPLTTHIVTTATSPIKIESRVESEGRKILFSEKLSVSSSNEPSKHSQLTTDTSLSVQSLPTLSSTSSNQEIQAELSEIKTEVEVENLQEMPIENATQLINNNPMYYIGISKDCYYLIDIIKEHTKLPYCKCITSIYN